MKFPGRIPHLLASYSPPVILGLVCSMAVLVMLMFRIDSAPARFSDKEIQSRQGSNSAKSIVNNPVNAPHKLVQYTVQKTGRHGTTAMRSASVLFGALILAAFYFLIESWHTRRVAIITTALFATSSWFLHIARSATPEILLVILPMLLFSAAWLKERKLTKFAVVLLIFAAVGVIYIPGFIWIVMAGIIWQFKIIWRGLSQLPYSIIIPCSFLTVVALSPLVYASIMDPSILKTIAGLPADMPTLSEFLRRLSTIPGMLVWRGPSSNEYWLPGTPLLDIFCLAMLLVGAYAYIFRLRLDRTRLLIGFVVLGMIMIGLGGLVSVSILLPIAYIVIAAGIAWILQQWFTVFPRNPFARSIAISLVCVAVAVSAAYNLSHYFVAWQKAPGTLSTYVNEP